ncbi:hypothetical protein V6259_18440 [Marinomonas sp. TI.3.20]|uniref:hypothetical protein n=1 Tax=Marinomonas sp. TI.3.20 TaxID=3121296 RepID=UPI00311F619C
MKISILYSLAPNFVVIVNHYLNTKVFHYTFSTSFFLAAHFSGKHSFSCKASDIALANALGSFGGTNQPALPTIRAASSTSVVTQGVPQAMASFSALEKA